MKFFQLIITLLISQFGRNEGASCTTYNTSTTCDSNNLCTWILDAAGDYCACASDVPLEILFLMDISGSVGASAWQTEKRFVSNMITNGINNISSIGIMTFGTGAWSQWNFTDAQHPRTDISDYVENMTYTGGNTYMKTAIKAGITVFDKTGEDDIDNLMFLITDGDPFPSWTETVCDDNKIKRKLDKNDVEVVIIGVGNGWSQGSVSCLVDDPTSQIIEVEDFTDDDFDKVRQYTDSFSCPATISLQLTEVRIQDRQSGSDTNARFVEFYNNGVNINTALNGLVMSGIIEGTIDENIYPNITAGKYIVFYDASGGRDAPNCYECDTDDDTRSCYDIDDNGYCDDAIYIACTGTGNSCSFNNNYKNNNWTVQVQDDSDDSYIVDVSVTVGTWPGVPDGYTFENTDLTGSDFDGSIWAQSCTQYGTPGGSPLEDCTGDCDPEACTAQGDTSATCTTTDPSYCNCTTSAKYYLAGSSCYLVEQPDSCTTTVIKDDTFYQQVTIAWDEVTAQTGTMKYRVEYTEGATKPKETVSSPYKILPVDEANAYTSATDAPRVRTRLEFNDSTYIQSGWIDCPITTAEPTLEPTFAPTYAIAPIDSCTVTISRDSTALLVEWTAADTSAENVDPELDGYYIFYTDYTASSPELTTVDTIDGDDTDYSLSLANLPSQPFDSDDLVMNISAIGYEGDDMTVDRARMLVEATNCDLVSPAPTPVPTGSPSKEPTPPPNTDPSTMPTPAPTFEEWVLSNCTGYIDDGALELSWDQNDPGNDRELWLRRTIAGTSVEQEDEIFVGASATETTFYAQDNINETRGQDTWELYVIAAIDGVTDTEQGTTVCDVTSASPTGSPTKMPSGEPTDSPTRPPNTDPTPGPSQEPTMSPTYREFNITDCEITIQQGDDRFLAEFTQPIYNEPALPPPEEVRYIFEYTDDDDTIRTDDSYVGTASGATFSQEILLDYGIDIDEGVTVHAVWTGDSTDVLTVEAADCVVNTGSPSASPTTQPPTMSPTYESPVCRIRISTIESDPACTNDTSTGGYECHINEANTAAEIDIIREPIPFGEEVTVEWEIQMEDDDGRRRTLSKEASRRLLQTTQDPDGGFVTDDDFLGDTDGEETFSAFQTLDASASFIVRQEPASSETEGTERFYFVLTSCESEGIYTCSIGYPGEVLIYVGDTSGTSEVTKSEGDLPTWIWYPVAAGALLLPIVGWLGWRFYNKKKLAEQMEQQRKQELQDQLALDDAANFGEVGDAVQFNPLATGGTQDIATGGDYIQKELDAQKANFEVAHVDIETNVFRQDFGPVQTNQRV